LSPEPLPELLLEPLLLELLPAELLLLEPALPV
jgi:hypothetical protein